jgi:hypothetical protein
MKSSIIYEKKKITIGEFISQYNTNLIWFCVLLINLISNYYLNNFLSNLSDLNLFPNETICGNQLELLLDKLCFSKKLIYVGLLINLFLMFTYKKITSCLEIIFRTNSKEISFIPIWLYCLSSIIYKPILIYTIYYDMKNQFNQGQDPLTLTIGLLYYFIIETLALVLILILVFISIIIFFDYISNIIYNFYKSNIKDITFEYTESKFVDIEKNI